MRFLLVLMIFATTLCAVGAYAQDTAGEVAIFKGDDAASGGYTLESLGSGKVSVTSEQKLIGANSVKIQTQGLYAGGTIVFKTPVTLFSGGIQNDRYIQFALFFSETKVVNPTAGTNASSDIEPYTMPKASKVRFVFESESGVSVCAEQAVNQLDPDDNWMRVAIPLAKFKTTAGDATEFKLKRLTITSDSPSPSAVTPATMFLGEMKLVTDTAPIKVESLDTQTVAIMDDVFVTATAFGGVSSLSYSWDFDADNGIQTESTDRIAHFVYTKGKTDTKGQTEPYVVTLTVSDVDGIKKPVTVTTTIEVID